MPFHRNQTRNMQRNSARGNGVRRNPQFQVNGPSSSRAPRTGTRDEAVHERSLTYYQSVKLTASSNDYHFGVGDTQFNANGTSAQLFFQEMSNTYEQYKVTRLQFRVSPGKGMTTDDRGKGIVMARVDVDAKSSQSNIPTLRTIAAAANTKTFSLSGKGGQLILDYKPIMRPNSNNNNPYQIFPNALQWYDCNDIHNVQTAHLWNGGNIVFMLPNEGSLPGKAITIIVRATIAFRGRRVYYPSVSNASPILENSDMMTVGEPVDASVLRT